MLTRHSAPIIFKLCCAKFVRSAITSGAGGCIGAQLVLADYKEDDRVLYASPIFMLIAYYLGFTNRNGNLRRNDDGNIKK
jgi:hypothetical protein